MFRFWYGVASLAVESQQAIWLRLLKLNAGGPNARKEANLMVSEKTAAARNATRRLMLGASPNSVVQSYRKKVRANVRRLSKR
jgi:hypothetical protein